jgi:carboxymethylenebutenolidase
MKHLVLLGAFALMTILNASAQDWAKARMEKSPRHLEWIKLKHGSREVNSFIAFPEVPNKATAVVVIHEIFGHTDWVRELTDELAAAGYIAIAPDLLSGTPAERAGDNVRKEISQLPQDQITADVQSAVDYVSKLPACNGKVVVAGFCWGGRESFRFACNSTNIKADFVFYGETPSETELKKITCPVYGFYAGNDARISAGVPATVEEMKKLGKKYEDVIYKGAGHGFMRAGEAPDANAANKKAREEAWTRWMDLLKKI